MNTLNWNAKTEKSTKGIRSASSEKSINVIETVKIKEMASEPLELPAPKFLVFINTEEGCPRFSSFLTNKAITGKIKLSRDKYQKTKLVFNEYDVIQRVLYYVKICSMLPSGCLPTEEIVKNQEF